MIREPAAVLFGVLAFACAAGAAWQAGLCWPAAAGRPLARIAAGSGLVLAAVGFSLGYWEVLSGIGDLIYHFDPPVIRFLFDMAALGLPLAILGLLLSVTAMLYATDVPARAIIPAIVAGYAIGWVLNPYQTLAGPRMDPVRVRYMGAQSGAAAGTPGNQTVWNLYGGGDGGGSSSGGSSGSGGGSGGGGGGFGGDGEGGAIILLIALAVLAVAGGVITAGLVFGAARKKAKAALSARTAFVAAGAHRAAATPH